MPETVDDVLVRQAMQIKALKLALFEAWRTEVELLERVDEQLECLECDACPKCSHVNDDPVCRACDERPSKTREDIFRRLEALKPLVAAGLNSVKVQEKQ